MLNDKIKIFQYTIIIFSILIVIGIGIILYKTANLSKKTLSPKISETSKLFNTPSLSGVDLHDREKIKPSRPEDLGITVYYEDNKPKTQEEWNAFISKSYQNNRKEFQESYDGKFGPSPYQQLDNADIEEIDTNRVRIDKNILEFEEKLKANPDDKDAKVKLENWRKFKAILIAAYGEKSNVEK